MKVFYLSNSPEIGGGNRSLLTLWRELLARGVQVAAACPDTGPMEEVSREVGVPLIVVPYVQPGWSQPWQSLRGFRRWREALREQVPDLVHGNGFFGARSVALAAKGAGVPLLCHVRFPVQELPMRWAFRGLPKPRAFLFNSYALRAEMEPALRRFCPSAELLVVHNAVDLSRFTPRPVGGRGPARVGIVANLRPVKGHKDFLRMARLLRARGVESDFVIIGKDLADGSHELELRQVATELGVAGDVEFLGYRADIPAELHRLDVLVCCSHVEPFGRVVAEAMACAVPVVATRVGGIPEVLEDGEGGYLVPVRSPARLADRVQSLLLDASDRRRQGQLGRRRAECLFGEAAHADRMLEIYRRFARR